MQSFLTYAGRSLFASALLLWPGAVVAESWPQFRGVNAAGVADEAAKPPVTFGKGQHEAWSVKVPSGSSSPVIHGGRLFLTAFDGGRLKTLCFNCEDGALLWEKLAPEVAIEPYFEKEGSPAAPSVATDGEHVVSYFGSFGVLCYDLDGKALWSRQLPQAEDPYAFGTGSSPIIHRDLVILLRDYKPTDSHLMALDLKTGETRWATPRAGFPSSYGTPIVWRHGDTEELIVPGSLKLCAYDFAGKETWSVGGLAAVVCTSPVATPEMLYMASWSTGSYGDPFPEFSVILASGDADKNGELTKEESEATFLKGFFRSFDQDQDGVLTATEWRYIRDYASRGKSMLMAIRPGAKGDATETHVAWTFDKGMPYVPSALAYRDCVYVVRDGGLVSCFDAVTGKPHYERARLGASGNYYASPVAADGRIYSASLQGEMAVFEAGPTLNVLAVNDLGERVAGTPAIVGDTLYVRTATQLRAFR